MGEFEPYFPMEFTPQCPQLRWLCDHLDGWQFGEQGLIEKLAETLGVRHSCCVEYGAGDGRLLPLTLDRLCKQHQSRCLLIEIESARRQSLKQLYPFAELLEYTDWRDPSSSKAEIVVIDIDGSDSVVMREMFAAGVRPTILVVEHMDRNFPIATSAPKLIPQWLLGLKLENGHAIQDTAETLHVIAAEAGYERIGYNRCNSFFVVRERYAELFR